MVSRLLVADSLAIEDVGNKRDALQMYTTWGAFAGFKENEIGKPKLAYRADRDNSHTPVKDLLKTRVLAAYVRG